MAQPITWRNVRGPDFSDSNRLLVRGNEATQRGLQTIQSAAEGFATDQRELAQEQSQSATQDLLNQIQGLDAAGLAAARDTGQFDVSNQKGINKADKQRIFQALKGQDAVIEQNAAAKFERQRAAQARAEHPVRQEALGFFAQGKFDEGRKRIEESGIANTAGLLAEARKAERQYRQDQLQDSRIAREEKTRVAYNAAANLQNEVQEDNARILSELSQEFGDTVQIKDGKVIYNHPQLGEGVDARTRKVFEEDNKAFEEAFEQAAIDKGLKKVPTFAETRRKLANDLRSIGTSPEAFGATLESFGSNFDATQQLGTRDRQQLATDIKFAMDDLDLKQQINEENYQALVNSSPLDPATTAKRRGINLTDVLLEAETAAPKNSFFGGLGGKKLKEKVQDLANLTFTEGEQVHRVEPWMISYAIKLKAQTEGESWGNRTVDDSDNSLEKIVKLLATDTADDMVRNILNTSKAKLDKARLALTGLKKSTTERLTKEAFEAAKLNGNKSAASDIFARIAARQTPK